MEVTHYRRTYSISMILQGKKFIFPNVFQNPMPGIEANLPGKYKKAKKKKKKNIEVKCEGNCLFKDLRIQTLER